MRSAMPGPWADWADASLQRLQNAALMRHLRPLLPTNEGTRVSVHGDVLQPWAQGDGHDSVNSAGLQQSTGLATEDAQMHNLRLFSTNDYLGMSTHPSVRRAAADAALAHGSGPRSSAVVGGYTQQHMELEAALAKLKGKEAALLFPTGFAANSGAIASLASGGRTHIFSDELNHASIIDGARLAARSGTQLHVYRHNDMRHLEELLLKVPSGQRKLVVTDSLFSMDGDWADLRGLARLRRRYGFLLAIDEAHATLVIGPRGGGWAEAQSLTDQVDVVIGTLSKAVGAQGGFVASSARLKQLLLNLGRPYIFSTALPAPIVAAAQAALEVAEQESWRRQHLERLWKHLGRLLGVQALSPIVPLVIGSETATLAAASKLLAAGFYVPAIRPPTVPPGTSRLRISLSAAHSIADVDALVAVIRSCDLHVKNSNQQVQFHAAGDLQQPSAETQVVCSSISSNQVPQTNASVRGSTHSSSTPDQSTASRADTQRHQQDTATLALSRL